MSGRPPKTRTVRVPVGPRLKILLYVVFGLFALLAVNSLYLVAVRVLEWRTGAAYQNFFYLQMFLLHLIFGLLLVVPTLVFAGVHIRNTYQRVNRRAVRAGFALFAAVLALLISGVLLTRIDGVPQISQPQLRGFIFLIHVAAPLFVIWLYVLHRLAGRRIQWRAAGVWAAMTAACVLLLVVWQAQDPRAWNVAGPKEGQQYFFPSLARTSSGNFIPARVLKNDDYCIECHTTAHQAWSSSAHRFSSFNNPAYLFSIQNTRQALMVRHGNVQGSRFCAGCHDPVPFFSGAFDDPKYDDPNYDLAADPQAQAGITCTACHAISHVNSPRGNADYTIDEPIHYPFAFSNSAALQWVNRQLVKAKPSFHKRTFLKPLHQKTEFCGTCHKVHLPPELNDYRWLRGQNHHDSFWLSGVSGHGVASFYYPAMAEENCNGCHMPDQPVASDSKNFAARPSADGPLVVSNHTFPGANTALPHLLGDQMADPIAAMKLHRQFLESCLRVDIFGVRSEGRIDGPLHVIEEAPFALEAGQDVLLEVVLRTLNMGHHLTQGTVDSNELWVDCHVQLNGETIGRSGGRRAKDNAVDPWSHFINAFVIDRDGNRINRRNAEDIFIALYNNQIPPGAADVVHYLLQVPPDAQGTLKVTVEVNYRKFDTEFYQLFLHSGDAAVANDLPVVTMAKAEATFVVGDSLAEGTPVQPSIPLWQRWNDYGIGLLRRQQLRQAESAFRAVEQLENPAGALNLARVYLAEGRVTQEAPAALRRAREIGNGADDWSILWFSGLVNKQLGELEAAIDNFQQIVDGGFQQAVNRGFHFERDYRLLIELADTLYLRALQNRGPQRQGARTALMEQARDYYLQALKFDPENSDAHYGVRRVCEALGDEDRAGHHAGLHERYKLNDNATDQAIAAARRKYPAANRAAERVVIYDLQRPEAYGLQPATRHAMEDKESRFE